MSNSSTYYVCIEADSASDKVVVEGRDYSYYLPGSEKADLSLLLDDDGNVFISTEEGKDWCIPLHLLQQLSDIKRIIDVEDKWVFGGKSRIYCKEID